MKLFKETMNNDKGYALPMALVLLLMGALMIVPCLSLLTTSLNKNVVLEQKTLEYYSADAGINDALWRIKNDEMPEWILGTWNDTTYSHSPYITDPNDDPPYPALNINQRGIETSIKPVWALEGLETPSSEQGRNPPEDLVIVGDVIGESGGNGIYQISIIYNGIIEDLEIERIACWLPMGFEYVSGTCNLEESGEPYFCMPDTAEHNGGTVIIWDFSSAVAYDDLPSLGTKKVVNFEFTPNDNLQGSYSWMRTNQVNPKLSWDVDLKIYKITSMALSTSGKYTTVTAYTTKNEFRTLGTAMPGNYQATGNTLMRNHNGDGSAKRERLYKMTKATIDSIPANGRVEKIFLYWSGWKCKPWDVSELTEEEIQALPSDKKVNKVKFRVKIGADQCEWIEVTASASQVLPNVQSGSPHGWSYSCYADVTDIVTGYFGDDISGNGIYKIRHNNMGNYGEDRRYKLYTWKSNHAGEEENMKYTGYPLSSPTDGGKTNEGYEDSGNEDMWAYAGWSVIVIYTSPLTKGHSIHIYDEFRYCDENESLDFNITNFLAPQDVSDDPEAARLTCFVGEGDGIYSGDYIEVNGSYLSDPPVNPVNNAWNSLSNVLDGGIPVDGIDLDTYTISGGSGIIQPGDVEAEVELSTGTDSWNLVYVILSFRSEITTGNFTSYVIGGNMEGEE